MQEEHEKLHRRGELVKFAALVVILLLTVLVIAGLRPLIFDHIVPAVLGWDGDPSQPPNAGADESIELEATSEEVTPVPTPAATSEEESVPEQGEVSSPAPEATDASPPTSTPVTYEVQRGDTLVDIGESFGVSVDAIVQANGIANPNRIQPGDVLVIPTP